jgi:hypothetical protein
MEFDTIPKAQGRRSNDVTGAFQLFGAIVFVVLALYKPQWAYVFLGLTAICLFSVYEGRLELHRIDRIVESIQGKRDSRKQYAEGKHGDSRVRFFIGNPPSINYSVLVDGNKALERNKELRAFVNEAMRQEGLVGYKLLIDNDAIMLSKYMIIGFQVRVHEANSIYSILDRARRQFFDTHHMDAEPTSQAES